jgi:hypothetical protein
MYFLLHCCDELQIAHPWSCASPTLGANFSEYFACSSTDYQYRFCKGSIHCRLTLVLIGKKHMPVHLQVSLSVLLTLISIGNDCDFVALCGIAGSKRC